MRLLFEIFGQTLQTLWAHKLRSFLTMFGIAWGVGSLLLLVGLGEGFRSGNRKQFDEIGENVMFIWGGRAPAMNGSFTSLRWYFLTYRDFQDVQHDCPDVKLAAAVIQVKPAYAQQKTAKDAVKYQESPKDGQKCADCNFFQAPGSCTVVDGTISPNGWCRHFKRKGGGGKSSGGPAGSSGRSGY